MRNSTLGYWPIIVARDIQSPDRGLDDDQMLVDAFVKVLVEIRHRVDDSAASKLKTAGEGADHDGLRAQPQHDTRLVGWPGPWFVNLASGDNPGSLNSVNSFEYTAGRFAKYMIGPYLGATHRRATTRP